MFTQYALDLFDQGYRRLLPLVPGEKRPRFPNWQVYNTRDVRIEEIERWLRVCSKGGIGLAAGPVGALDFDHQNPEIAFAIRELADRIIGPTPLLRIGEAPKSLRLYRTGEGLVTQTLQDLKIGVYATTGQFVLYGIHPRTGRPYEWPEDSPLDVHADDLPVLTSEALEAFVSALRSSGLVKAAPVSRQRHPLMATDDGPRAHYYKLLESDPSIKLQDAVADYMRRATARHPAMVRCVAFLQGCGLEESAILDVIGDAYMQHFVGDGTREINVRYRKLIAAIRDGDRKGFYLDLNELKQKTGQANWGRLNNG